MVDKALLDANVLVPIGLCDLLLRTAEVGLFRPRWTHEILRETRRAIARTLRKQGLDPVDFMPRVDHRIEDMQNAFPDAMVTGWEPIARRVTLPDPDDRHVVAAARRAGATVIVTQNIDDFPPDRLTEGLQAITADAFLLRLLERSSHQVVACVRAQARETGKRGKTMLDVDSVLTRLSASTPEFVAAIGKQLAGG